MLFSDEKLTEPFEQVEGNITIEGVDFDCTCVMLQSKWGNYGKFNGEKLELEHFIKRYQNYSFEIVDELYGYNQVLYSGYLSILETKDLVQMDISIYFTGKIIYDTKEKQIQVCLTHNNQDNIMSCRKCETICGDCEWSEICHITESKNKKLICWINEEDKTLSFHQEEGFVQNEFTDRDELRCFLLAVSGIYRIQ